MLLRNEKRLGLISSRVKGIHISMLIFRCYAFFFQLQKLQQEKL